MTHRNLHYNHAPMRVLGVILGFGISFFLISQIGFAGFITKSSDCSTLLALGSQIPPENLHELTNKAKLQMRYFRRSVLRAHEEVDHVDLSLKPVTSSSEAWSFGKKFNPKLAAHLSNYSPKFLEQKNYRADSNLFIS